MTGDDLKEARELAGLTQQQVADAIGRHRTTVNAWEQRAEVRRANAKRVMQAINDLTKGKAA